MFANLEILTGEGKTSAVVIPQSAVVNTPDQKTLVFLENGDAFQPVEVSLGKQAAGFVEVLRGLFPGDRVVTQRAPQLYAESLKNPTAGDHSHEAETPSTSGDSNPLTQYWIYPAAGVLALGMFWAGVTWSRRSVLEVSDPLPSSVHQEQ